MKPVFCVAIHPAAPVLHGLFSVQVIQTPDGPMHLMNCTEVRETAYGFLQLVPKRAEGIPQLTFFVPATDVLWMAQAEKDSQLGFLSEARQAKPQSDQAG